jgi:hypothetical protein
MLGPANSLRSSGSLAPPIWRRKPWAILLGHFMANDRFPFCAWGQRHARELNELDELAECVIKPVHTKRSKVLRGLSLDGGARLLCGAKT